MTRLARNDRGDGGRVMTSVRGGWVGEVEPILEKRMLQTGNCDDG